MKIETETRLENEHEQYRGQETLDKLQESRTKLGQRRSQIHR